MIASKIGPNNKWKEDRLGNKEEYVEAVLDSLASEQSEGYSDLFFNMASADSEMRENLGLNKHGYKIMLDEGDLNNISWYEEHIRKQLMKLDTTALAFIHNCLEYPKI